MDKTPWLRQLNRCIVPPSIPKTDWRRKYDENRYGFPLLQFPNLVSIPYGTIKSGLTAILQTITVVSIPYGTIKRDFCADVYFIRFQFQFLMVRLKAWGDGLANKSLFCFNSLWYD